MNLEDDKHSNKKTFPPNKENVSPIQKVIRIAAILILLIGGFLLFPKPETEVATAPTTPVVAVLTHAENAVWTNGQAIGVGSALHSGRWELESGRIEAVLDDRVELFIDGPAVVNVVNSEHAALLSGKLSARVSPAGIGFRVITPDMEIIGLGTEFSVSVEEGKPSDVRVIDGFVNTTPHLAKDAGKRLSAGEVLHGDHTDVPFNSPRPQDPSLPITGGDIRLIHSPPHSMRNHALEHDYPIIFREKTAQQLTEDLPVSLHSPGATPRSRAALKELEGVIEEGTSVDSWMIHLDGARRTQLFVEAEIEFKSDVLGIIITQPLLASSDPTLGLPNTEQTRHPLRGMEIEVLDSKKIDELVLSEDRRRLKLRWHVSTDIDQIRVLTEPVEK